MDKKNDVIASRDGKKKKSKMRDGESQKPKQIGNGFAGSFIVLY